MVKIVRAKSGSTGKSRGAKLAAADRAITDPGDNEPGNNEPGGAVAGKSDLGLVKVIALDPDDKAKLGIPFAPFKVEIADVDVVLVFADGSRIIIPGMTVTDPVTGEPIYVLFANPPGTGIAACDGGGGTDMADHTGALDGAAEGTAGIEVFLDGRASCGGDAVTDTLDYSTSAAGVAIVLDGAAGSGGDAAGDMLRGIERVVGGAGNDLMSAGGGADTLQGGTGFDVAGYGASAEAVTVALDGSGGVGGDAEGDTLSDIEA